MATALTWLGYQHTLTRMLQLVPLQGSVVIAIDIQWLKVCVPHGLMMFGEIISMIGVASVPKNVKLSLACLVMNPIKMHANCLGAFLFHSVIDDAACHTVVSL